MLSKSEISRNNKQICGRKITVPPMPATTPLARRSRIAPSGSDASTSPPRWAKMASIQSMGYAASAKMTQNSPVITAMKVATPSTGCVNARSSRSDRAAGLSPSLAAAMAA